MTAFALIATLGRGCPAEAGGTTAQTNGATYGQCRFVGGGVFFLDFNAMSDIQQRLRELAQTSLDAADLIDQQNARIYDLEQTVEDLLFSSSSYSSESSSSKSSESSSSSSSSVSSASSQSSQNTEPQFTYLGTAQVPGVGINCCGLAHDPVSKKFWTIGQAGNNPFNLHEFQINVAALNPATKINASGVAFVGALNTNDPLRMANQAIVNMKGLLYENGKLQLNYCSYYANGFNLPCAAWYDIATKTIIGPFTVDPSVHSDRVKGLTLLPPAALAAATGRKYVTFGIVGSTAQLQSWGLGLVALDGPAPGQLAMTNLPAAIVSHWPQKILPNVTPIVPYSDYPGDPNYPIVYLQRQTDGSVKKIPMTGGVSMQGACFVGPKTLLVVGSTPWGNAWYGNYSDFTDVPSLVDPTKMTMGPGSYRGGYVETTIDKYWLVSVDEIIAKLAAGDKKIKHYKTGRFNTFGGSVSLPSQSFVQPYYDAARSLLFVTNYGSIPNIHVYSVKL